jgi:hypothetical protein
MVSLTWALSFLHIRISTQSSGSSDSDTIDLMLAGCNARMGRRSFCFQSMANTLQPYSYLLGPCVFFSLRACTAFLDA